MNQHTRIIGVPTDYGANRRGVDMGPSALRYAGLVDELSSAGVSTEDAGDLAVPHHAIHDADAGGENAKHINEVEEVTTALADAVADALSDEVTPLVLGGDHSIAIGSMVGSARDADIGVVWFDAHGDFNTPETSPSGNVHGMPLAAALGIGDFEGVEWANAPRLKEENVAIVGLRDVDENETTAIQDSDVTAYTMSDIDERGITEVTQDALDVATNGTDGVHVSLDLDWLDPREAPGVGTPVRGGVTYREAHAAMELVAESGAMRSLELVEVNPILDEHNETAAVATELAASGFGKRIL
ncbi:arginase [Halogeometricum borinquense DSM 11551]|uniref:Arginase n=3 Tax=Halogeometricum borinquense TaxID=60847 RepID=E4NLL6_HALBP|nr:arginase [Halogeometricum borinquense]ADQ67219.1 arginase [Halogeometricum borinquense DSM 11551]ELY29766.1 arginase [Halogeometricum borinquense DSM 11551]RYJ13826.1 arginase [Halogeometricum borinquense]